MVGNFAGEDATNVVREDGGREWWGRVVGEDDRGQWQKIVGQDRGRALQATQLPTWG